MKFIIQNILITIVVLMIFNACADVQDEIITNKPASVHPEGFGIPGSDNFHTVWFKENNWDLKFCTTCHGTTYDGGITEVTCLNCHTQSAGPEACNTCHGDFADPNFPAPPKDLTDAIETSSPGVGAHSIHLYGGNISREVGCYECHPSETEGDEKYVFAHIGPPPADVVFSEFVSKFGTPEYSYSDFTCADTYCHGNFKFEKAESEFDWAYTDSEITGENFQPIWNKVDSTQAVCGSCHTLPPRGHINAGNDPEATSCGLSFCHVGIVDLDGNIIDKLKHINGSANVQGN
jgi:hypothetical protein